MIRFEILLQLSIPRKQTGDKNTTIHHNLEIILRHRQTLSTYTTSKIGNRLGESVFTLGLKGKEKHKGIENT